MRAGENSGATLHHERVVRQWIGPVPLVAGNAQIRRDIRLDDADANAPADRFGVVGFVENATTGEVLQVADLGRVPVGRATRRGASSFTGDSHGNPTCSQQHRAARPPKTGTIHPVWVRVTHWLNALAAIVMMLSGWRIYDASPIFHGFTFPPDITLGGWLGGALQWHFAAMWLLVFNGLAVSRAESRERALRAQVPAAVAARRCCTTSSPR